MKMASCSGICVAMRYLVVTLLMCGSVCAQIKCYNCSSDPNTGADIGSCRVAGSATNTTSNCTACSTSFSTGANGVLYYSRSCSYTQPPSLGCSSNIAPCYCNSSDLCNGNALLIFGTLTCYSCSSSYVIDNGCGEKMNATSAHAAVLQLSGCTSCTTTTTSGPYGPLYTRGCVNAYQASDPCGQSATVGCSYTCNTNLCNSSARLVSLRTATALFIAALFLVEGVHRQKYTLR
jgi:hypothetical protein